jgi:hypothetical protein
MISHVIKGLRWYFMWRIRALSAADSETRVDQHALEDVRDKRTEVIDELSQVITQRPPDELRNQAQPLIFASLIGAGSNPPP